MEKHKKNYKPRKNLSERNKEEKSDKKFFDKKKYRVQKYSNQHKVNQWDERRKKAIIRDYYKDLKRNQNVNSREQSDFTNQAQTSKTVRKGIAFQSAKREYINKKEETLKKKREILKAKTEREEALKKYNERKKQNLKRLSKKTKKGQPVMKDRMEMLLEKIQETVR